MKNVQQHFKNYSLGISILFVFALVVSSCTKSQPEYNIPAPAAAAVTVIDASPDAVGVDFYISGSKLNSSPLTLGTFISYFSVTPGKKPTAFYVAGTITPAAQDTITFVANHNYSLLLANVAAKPDYILLNDSISKPATGNIGIRLLNVSSDAGAADLVIKSSATKIATNDAYKKASAFVSVSLSATDTLQVMQTGTTTVLAKIPTANLISNTVYTVLLYGLANTTIAAQKLKAGIMANAAF